MKKSVAIIGGGAAALILAAQLNETKFNVSIYEKNQALGRKFLVAGDGGFNLTHAEPLDTLITRYTQISFLENSIKAFSNEDLRKWLDKIGVPTFAGTSNRVFPVEGIKPINVLEKFLVVLKNKNVTINTQHNWNGWENNSLVFDTKGEKKIITADIVVFALGGASWSVTGSDGTWSELFKQKGIHIVPFQASNCAVKIEWTESLLQETEGKALKNISLSCGDKQRKGDAVLTKFGMEGTPVYYLAPKIRKQLADKNEAQLFIDLKPDKTENELCSILEANKGRRSVSDALKKEVGLNAAHISLLKSIVNKNDFTDPPSLAGKIKKLPVTVTGLTPIDEAISTVGGIALNEVDEHLQLKKLNGNYVIGEMLDWDAPTGGYLLQACFSMGHWVAQHLNKQG